MTLDTQTGRAPLVHVFRSNAGACFSLKWPACLLAMPALLPGGLLSG